MSTISESGLANDEFGQLVLVTQGLTGYTLVAGKKILFRLFLDPSAIQCATVLATITYSVFGFQLKKSFLIPNAFLLIENTSPNGPSVGVLFKGDAFPFPFHYEVEFFVYGTSPSVPHFRFPDLKFRMPGRLRLLIHNLRGKAPWGTQIEPDLSWLVEMFRSLERLSAMLPVRDGIKLGLTHADAGLCFVYGGNIDTWPAVCPSGNPPPCMPNEMVELNLSETEQINSSGTAEHVDATVSWRLRDVTFPPPGGEGMGGKAVSYDSPPGKGVAFVVGGSSFGKEFTAPILAQEVGHLFGLEPRESPHFDDPLDGLHSKDPSLADPFAFDFDLLKPYQPLANAFIGDVMNNTGGGLSQGRDMVLYNAFDWEFLRNRLARLQGAPLSVAAVRRPSRKQQDELVEALQKIFAGGSEIRVQAAERVLAPREGLMWHWTHAGFRQIKTVKGQKGKSGFASSAEGILEWLDDLGISKTFAPVADHPLPMVINPKAYLLPHRKEFDVFDWPQRKEPDAPAHARKQIKRSARKL